jgi:hypothetical protein
MAQAAEAERGGCIRETRPQKPDGYQTISGGFGRIMHCDPERG